MKTIIGIGLVLTVLAFSSCREHETLTLATPNYMPMEIGNYWIYHWYFEDPNGNDTFHLGATADSTIIEKDTVINGTTYYKVVSHMISLTTNAVNHINVSFLRQSNTEVINHEGKTLFSANPPLGVFRIDTLVNDTPYVFASYSWSATGSTVSKTVNAGTFDCVENTAFATYVENGVAQPKPNVYTYYQDNVGRVQTNAYLLSNERKVEMRLERYHLN